MKLIIQIPCFNEQETLPQTFADLPKKIEGIDTIEVLVINDGSSDKTVEVAKSLGVNYVVGFSSNRGLAKAFEHGIEKCLELGADIIVNTDADNQYKGEDIAELVKPIINGEADLVVGDRNTKSIEHFSASKKLLQKVGSGIVRKLSGTSIPDAVSGFRAYSREAAIMVNIISDFSYTAENLIQLGQKRLRIVSVPVRTNPVTRKSRLFKSIGSFISNQAITITRAYSTYKALKVFTFLGLLILLPGIAGFIRFLYFYFTSGGDGHIQSLIFSTAFIVVGFVLIVLGVIADLISTNRKLLEKLLYHVKEEKWKK